MARGHDGRAGRIVGGLITRASFDSFLTCGLVPADGMSTGRCRRFPAMDSGQNREDSASTGSSLISRLQCPAASGDQGPDIDSIRTGRISWGMSYKDRITIEPGKRGGKPCIRGLRITVYEVLDYLASGMSEDQILQDFPDLEREDIRACLEFAADRERKLVSIPPE